MTPPDRRKEIARAGDACEKCHWLAWSNERQSQLQLRPRTNREGQPVGSWVLCPACTSKHDAKQKGAV